MSEEYLAQMTRKTLGEPNNRYDKQVPFDEERKRDLLIQRVQDQYKTKTLTMMAYLDKIARIYKPKKF